jgi:hypothetical protein
MCIFCVGDDAPFHLRKSTAFPRRMTAAQAGSAFACESAPATPAPSAGQTALSEPAPVRDGPDRVRSPDPEPKSQ